MTAPIRPLVPTAIVTEYGEYKEDPARLADAATIYADPTHVPGFSDLKHARDLDLAHGRKATPLPVNCRWFRRTRRDGQPTNERTVIGHSTGYRAVRFDEIGKVEWLTAMPAGAFKLPDGTIGTSDSQLMVLDQENAIRRSAAKTVKFLTQMTGSTDQALQQAGARAPGSNPEMTRELGPERR